MTVNADRRYIADEILMFDSDGHAVFRFEPNPDHIPGRPIPLAAG